MTTYPFAGFWRRFVAYMIDGFILSVVLILFMIIAGVAYFAGAVSGQNRDLLVRLTDPDLIATLTLWIWAISILTNIAYFTYFHGSSGRTPGKMLMGLQVVSADGAPISFGVAFLRSVGYLVSSFVFCLGYIWIGFDRRKQGWHDKIAGTVVIIREPQGSTAGLTIPDSSAAPRHPAGVDPAAGIITPAGMEKPEVASGEAATRPENQKIP